MLLIRRSFAGVAVLALLDDCRRHSGSDLLYPDAELIALADRTASADHRSQMQTVSFYDTRSGSPEHAGCDAAMTAVREIIATEYHPSIERAPSCGRPLERSCSPRCYTSTPDPENAIAVSLARDLLGGELTWRSAAVPLQRWRPGLLSIPGAAATTARSPATCTGSTGERLTVRTDEQNSGGPTNNCDRLRLSFG